MAYVTVLPIPNGVHAGEIPSSCDCQGRPERQKKPEGIAAKRTFFGDGFWGHRLTTSDSLPSGPDDCMRHPVRTVTRSGRNYPFAARSVISSPLSTIFSPSSSCASVITRGGFVKKVFQRTKV
jgi:hypothetical protein